MDEREVWWPPKRRLRLVVSGVQTAAGACSAALALADGQLLTGLLTQPMDEVVRRWQQHAANPEPA